MRDAQRQLGLDELSLPYIKIHSSAATFIVSKRAPNAEKLLADLDSQFELYNALHLNPQSH
jgi:hypothetical protein